MSKSSAIKTIGLWVLAACFSTAGLAGVSGFLDGQFHVDSKPGTFRLYDGSVWLTKEMGNGSGYVNLPFSGMAGGNGFNFAATKAEAYATWQYDFGVKWWLGQFASPFGTEPNSSWGLRFSEFSLLKDALPTTHTGLMASYTYGQFEARYLLSDPINTGSRTAGNFEAGGTVRMSQKSWYVQGGFLGYSQNSVMQTVIDATVGGKMNKATCDIDFVMSKPPVTGADTGIGVSGTLGYELTHMWGAGVRGEYLSKMNNLYIAKGSTLTNYTAGSILALTVGPQAKLTEDMKVKFDYTMMSGKTTSTAASTTTHMGTVAALYKF